MSDEESVLYLSLGCFGRSEDGFVLCPSVDNRILKIDASLKHYNEMMDLFDSYRLFDRPIMDANPIKNLAFHMQRNFDQNIKKLWSEKEFNLIERFMHMHKSCGLYMSLLVVPKELDLPIKNEPHSFLIEPSNYIEIEDPKFDATSIRGKR